MQIVGQERVAEMFGVAPKTIVEWQEQGMPIAERGRPGVPSQYVAADCIAWYLKRELGKVQSESPRDRLARLQADEVELKLMERRGLLVPAELIEPTWLSLISAAKTYLRSEPDRLAQLLEHAEGIDARRDLLADVFDEFLRKLSKFNPDADDEHDTDDDERPVGRDLVTPIASEGDEEAGATAEDVGSEMG